MNKKLINNEGMTLVEIIMSIAVLGIVICPLMSMIVLSQKINNDSIGEYKSLQQAQKYMEEIKSMDVLDTEKYPYNRINNTYEKNITQTSSNYEAEIKIIPTNNNILYNIEIIIKSDDVIINKMISTKIFK